ncbi:uncharacterized protein TNCV_2923521 [Trichonephila clavipes]|nr:uncharacterized protein TNCV_2923521 [Trichonephila clavipes]
MLRDAKEVREVKQDKNKVISCGGSVDGTWQRRGYSSLNDCAADISIDTGKVLDTEILSLHCRICNVKKSNISKENHVCSNFAGNSGNMDPVGVFRMFEHSKHFRNLLYSEYYCDEDSKALEDI